MGTLITAVVIDDHEAVRDGICSWCAAADPPITILASGNSPGLAWVGDGAGADVVILDLQLAPGGMQEFGELRRLVQAGRRVVVYTGDGEKKTALRCISHGAFAFVAKSEGKDHLVHAVQAAAVDKSYTPPSLSGSILADLDPSRPKLAPMEIEALRTWFSCASKELGRSDSRIEPENRQRLHRTGPGQVRRGGAPRAHQERPGAACARGRPDHPRRAGRQHGPLTWRRQTTGARSSHGEPVNAALLRFVGVCQPGQAYPECRPRTVSETGVSQPDRTPRTPHSGVDVYRLRGQEQSSELIGCVDHSLGEVQRVEEREHVDGGLGGSVPVDGAAPPPGRFELGEHGSRRGVALISARLDDLKLDGVGDGGISSSGRQPHHAAAVVHPHLGPGVLDQHVPGVGVR